MSDLVTHVTPLALGAAVSPSILTMSVLILSRDHGRSRMVAFTIANLIVLTAIGIAGFFAFKGTIPTDRPPSANAAAAAVDTALGLILVIFGIRAMLRPAPEAPAKEESKPDSGPQTVRFFLLGVVLMLSNFTTLALFLPADKEIVIATVPAGDKAIVLAGLIVVATVTAWLPLLLTVTVPRLAAPVLAALDRFTTVHRKAITVVVCLAFGAYLLVKGIGGG